MRRVDLVEATMQGWARLNPSQRERFFQAFVKAALRLDRLKLRAWLLRRLKNHPLAAPIDLARFTISDADMALLMKTMVGEPAAQASQGGAISDVRRKIRNTFKRSDAVEGSCRNSDS